MLTTLEGTEEEFGWSARKKLKKARRRAAAARKAAKKRAIAARKAAARRAAALAKKNALTKKAYEEAQKLKKHQALLVTAAKIAVKNTPQYKIANQYKNQIQANVKTISKISKVRNINDLKSVSREIAENAVKLTPQYQTAAMYKSYAEDLYVLSKVRSKNDLKKTGLKIAKKYGKQYIEEIPGLKEYSDDLMKISSIRNTGDLKSVVKDTAKKYGKEYLQSTPSYMAYKDSVKSLKQASKQIPAVKKITELKKSGYYKDFNSSVNEVKAVNNEINNTYTEQYKDIIDKYNISAQQIKRLQKQGVMQEDNKGNLLISQTSPEADYREGKIR